ncbi:acyltransferase family protein [Mucilaginibacter phyllosphaerae]
MADKPYTFIAIDVLRAIAALGVFFYHQHLGSILAKYSGIAFIKSIDNFGATYAVPLFFLISGYCIHLSSLKYLRAGVQLPLKAYYKRRLLRIYPPYLVALLFAIAVNYFTYGHYPSLTDFITHIFVLQGFNATYFNTINVVLWTITIEIAFYLIYPLFYYIWFKNSSKFALVCTFIVSSLSTLYFSFKPSVSLPGHFFVLNFWFVWCWGAYLADKTVYKTTDTSFKLINGIIILAFIILKVFPNSLFILSDQVNVLIWTIPLLLILSKEDWLKRHSNLIIRTIRYIGLSSYSLYLFHEPLITLKNYLAHQFLPQSLQLTGVALGIIFIPIITWYTYQYIEEPFATRKRIIG